ncbi:hypothetical protein PUN28_004873 [Cardiocondyla obscurior]|uniref:Uncharacterized protein n=1 Tax=Cardiocondyla obscurior TaxID=286306 RepID=A0AAW2GIW9_9HYME
MYKQAIKSFLKNTCNRDAAKNSITRNEGKNLVIGTLRTELRHVKVLATKIDNVPDFLEYVRKITEDSIEVRKNDNNARLHFRKTVTGKNHTNSDKRSKSAINNLEEENTSERAAEVTANSSALVDTGSPVNLMRKSVYENKFCDRDWIISIGTIFLLLCIELDYVI